MKKTDLIKIVNRAVKLTKNKSPVPILDDFLVSDNKMIATDFQVSLINHVPFEGCFTINIRFLAGLLKHLDAGVDVDLVYDTEKNKVGVVVDGKQLSQVASQNPDDFPAMSEAGFSDFGWLEKEDTNVIVSLFSLSCTDPRRVNLSGVYLDDKAGRIVVTDTFRLCYRKLGGNILHSVIIPDVIGGLLDKNTAYRLEINEKGDQIKFVEVHTITGFFDIKSPQILICRLPDGNYPDYENVIPDVQTAKIRLYFDKSVLVNVVRQALTVADPVRRVVRFAPLSENDKMLVSSGDADILSDFSKAVGGRIEGDWDFTFAVNGEFLLSILNVIYNQNIELAVWDVNRAILINENNLLMPVITD